MTSGKRFSVIGLVAAVAALVVTAFVFMHAVVEGSYVPGATSHVLPVAVASCCLLAAVYFLYRLIGPWAALALCAFIALAMALASDVSPIDEVAHFAYAEHIARQGRLPTLYDYNSLEMLAFYNKSYPSLPSMGPETLGPNNLLAVQYEAQHPPLSYLVNALVFLAVPGSYIPKLYAMRLMGVILLAASVVLTLKAMAAARRADDPAGGDARARVACFLAVALALANPGVIRLASTVNYTACAIFLSSVLMLMIAGAGSRLAFSPVRAAILGVVAASLLLTTWCGAGMFLVTGALVALRSSRRSFVTFAIVVVLLGAPLMVHNLATYGALTGDTRASALLRDVVGSHGSRAVFLAQAFPPWMAGLVSPQDFGPSPWPYGYFCLAAGLACVGAVVLVARDAWRAGRGRGLAPRPVESVAAAMVLATMLEMIAVAVCEPHTSLAGRFAYPMWPFLAMVVAAALERAVLPRRLLWPGIAVALIVIPANVWMLLNDLDTRDVLPTLAGTRPIAGMVDFGLAPTGNRHIPGGLTRPGQMVQRFVCPVDGLSGVRLMLCTLLAPQVRTPYRLNLYEGASPVPLRRVLLDPARIHDWGWYSATFASLPDSRGREYRFELVPLAGAVETPITPQFCPCSGRTGGEALVDGKPSGLDAVFQLEVWQAFTWPRFFHQALGF